MTIKSFLTVLSLEPIVARQTRKAKHEKVSNKQQNQTLLIIAIVVLAVIIIAGIYISLQP